MMDASDTGRSFTDDVTAQAQPVLQGTGEPNTQIRLLARRTDGAVEVVGQGLVRTDGTWQVSVQPLANDRYELQAEFEDRAGNVSDPEPTVDDRGGFRGAEFALSGSLGSGGLRRVDQGSDHLLRGADAFHDVSRSRHRAATHAFQLHLPAVPPCRRVRSGIQSRGATSLRFVARPGISPSST